MGRRKKEWGKEEGKEGKGIRKEEGDREGEREREKPRKQEMTMHFQKPTRITLAYGSLVNRIFSSK